MDFAIIVTDRDHIPIIITTGRPMVLMSSPVVDVAVCYLLIDGSRLTPLPGGRLAVVTACGVEPWAPEGLDHVFISYVGP